ncbi:hypothetical protein LINPERHAP1_LOCUS30907, partial [Linum perenne]
MPSSLIPFPKTVATISESAISTTTPTMIDCNESAADFHQQETIPTSKTNDTTADLIENIMNINAAEEPISGSGSGSSSSVSRAEIALDKINPKDSSTWEDLRFPTKIDAQGFYKRYARLNG